MVLEKVKTSEIVYLQFLSQCPRQCWLTIKGLHSGALFSLKRFKFLYKTFSFAHCCVTCFLFSQINVSQFSVVVDHTKTTYLSILNDEFAFITCASFKKLCIKKLNMKTICRCCEFPKFSLCTVN